MTGSLDGCRAKVERAKKHVSDLQNAIDAFFKTNPYVVGPKRDPETRKLIYYVVSVRDTPLAIPAIAGDAFQNLRSALDHLAFQLWQVGTGGKGPFEHVYFPARFNSAAEYKAKRLGQVQGMRPDAIKAIDAVEPYKGGKGDILWRLHQLNLIDKHRLLLTVGSAYRSIDIGGHLNRMFVEVFPERKGRPTMSLHLRPADRLCPLEAGDELFIDHPDAEVDKDLKFTFEVALSEPQVADGEPLVETVKQMSDIISDLIPTFEPLLV